jgi:TPR repeat protein
MASRYQKGDGVQQDLQKCINYYEMACDEDNGEAEYKLAMIYLLGESIPSDYLKGYDVMKRASDKGYDKARKLFISTAWSSQDVPTYPKIIMNMFIDAAQNGRDDSHYLLGYRCDEGTSASIIDTRVINYTKVT